MHESVFLNEGGVIVSDAQLVVAGKTYDVQSITGARKWVDKATRAAGLMAGFVGLIGLLLCGIPAYDRDPTGGMAWLLLSMLIPITGFVVAVLAKPNYQIIVATAAGEGRILSSKDAAFIDRVFVALGKAIAPKS